MKLCVPWFEGEEGASRVAAWSQCRDHWERRGVEIVPGTGVSRAAARNSAAAQVTDEVLLFADADTVVPYDQLEMAADLAKTADSLVIAYRTIHMLARNVRLTPQLLVHPHGYPVRDASNGVIAISRCLWDELGGFDERFTSWGGEDRAFMYSAVTLRDQELPLRVPGHALHLWHRPARAATRPSPARTAGIGLALRYKAASGREPREGTLARLPGATRNRQVLEALLHEPGAPLEGR